MMKDRGQKAAALRYIVAKRWFPQLELDVIPQVSTSPTELPVTDIDVFASIPDEFHGYRRLLIDCKTKRGESPISRAFWQRGVMEYMDAQRAICILRRDIIQPDHRYIAAQFQVLLMTEEDFDRYAVATGVASDAPYGNIGVIDNWEKYFDISKRFSQLAPAIQFSKSYYWMIQTEAEASRIVISTAWDIHRELDPVKPEHLAIVGDLAALLMHSLAKLVTKVFAGYLQPKNRTDLSEALLFLIYGGRESYEHRNTLKQKLESALKPGEDPSALTPPLWNTFIQLIRQALDAPTEIPQAPLLLREIAWTMLANNSDLSFATTLANESPQAAKLALLGIEYLCKAAKLPPEFTDIYVDLLMIAQEPVESTVTSQEVINEVPGKEIVEEK